MQNVKSVDLVRSQLCCIIIRVCRLGINCIQILSIFRILRLVQFQKQINFFYKWSLFVQNQPGSSNYSVTPSKQLKLDIYPDFSRFFLTPSLRNRQEAQVRVYQLPGKLGPSLSEAKFFVSPTYWPMANWAQQIEPSIRDGKA